MTKEQIIDVAKKYKESLSGYGEPCRYNADIDVLKSSDALLHASWMCEQVIEMANNDKLEKAFRWLGFIQGVLWVTREASISELRKDNR